MAAKPAESKQGLVVTLVFFILATIGLGVTAYYGFAEQEKLKADVKKKTQEADDNDKERNWYMFQVGYYRACIGDPAPAAERIGRELAQGKASFDGGQLGSKYKDYQEVKALAAKLEARSKWDAKESKPEASYEKLLEQRDTKIKEMTAALAKETEDRLTAQKERDEKGAALEAAKKAHETAEGALKRQFDTDRNEFARQIGEVTANLRQAEKLLEPDIKAKSTENAELLAQKNKLAKELKAEREQVASLQEQLGGLKADSERKRPSQLIPRGEITRVHTNQRGATISLGRAQGLTSGTTFAIHGIIPGGKLNPLGKGIVEVVTVGQDSSDVIIRELFHPDPNEFDPKTGARKVIDVVSKDNTDPIIRGDKLINPLWDPDSVTHVAIAGQVDLGGLRVANVAGLIRQLEKQKVVVDAYIDPTDGAVKGTGINRKTKYLILGAAYIGGEAGLPRNEQLIKQMNDSRDKLRNEARNSAVDLVNPERFLSELNLGRE